LAFYNSATSFKALAKAPLPPDVIVAGVTLSNPTSSGAKPSTLATLVPLEVTVSYGA
jgi:hypothetical protein